MKRKILDELISKVKLELEILEKSAEAAKNLATDQEFKSESKYDTRALEASYLASAETKRVEELKLEIQILEDVDINASSKLGEVAIGALIELSFQGQARNYFLIPTSGGTLVDIDGNSILVVSVFSPIGSEVLGLKVGEEFEVETPKGSRIYKVLSFS